MSDLMDKPPQRRSLQAQIQELDQLIAERRAVSIPRSSFNATRRRAENEERLIRLQCARETLANELKRRAWQEDFAYGGSGL